MKEKTGKKRQKIKGHAIGEWHEPKNYLLRIRKLSFFLFFKWG